MLNFTVNGKDYPLCINTKAAVNIEEELGYNPINVLIRMKFTNELPKFKDLMVILHQSLQKYNHGISYNDTLGLFDRYCDEGGDITKLIELVVKAMEQGGLIKLDNDPNL